LSQIASFGLDSSRSYAKSVVGFIFYVIFFGFIARQITLITAGLTSPLFLLPGDRQAITRCFYYSLRIQELSHSGGFGWKIADTARMEPSEVLTLARDCSRCVFGGAQPDGGRTAAHSGRIGRLPAMGARTLLSALACSLGLGGQECQRSKLMIAIHAQRARELPMNRRLFVAANWRLPLMPDHRASLATALTQ
jgi:hypothetical protein